MKRKETQSSRAAAKAGKEVFRAERILVPLDFSDASRTALRYADSLAKQSGGKLVLFYALEPVGTPDFAYHPLVMEPKQAEASARLQLDKMCLEEGVSETRISETIAHSGGVAHAQITDMAEKLGMDLIVIATHGNTGLKHVL